MKLTYPGFMLMRPKCIIAPKSSTNTSFKISNSPMDIPPVVIRRSDLVKHFSKVLFIAVGLQRSLIKEGKL